MKFFARVRGAVYHAATGRSPHWPAARRAHLDRQRACEACGSTLGCEVHHVEPFHVRPDRELDPANLMTLCERPGSNHHLRVGHRGDWKSYNPDARADAAEFLAARALPDPF